MAGVGYSKYTLPNDYSVVEGRALEISSGLPVSVSYKREKNSDTLQNDTDNSSFDARLNLFGLFPVKDVNISVVSKNKVAVLGSLFGIKIFTDGVLVVKVDTVDTEKGNKSPAKNAGIEVGDYILTVCGEKVTCNEDVAKLVEESMGKKMVFCIKRNGKKINLMLTPELSYSTGKYKAGVWVKDSSAGIGTLTFYNPYTNIIGGLGHAVCDSETGTILSLEKGELVTAEIVGVEKGVSGSPGGLKGKFSNVSLGELLINNETGVFAQKTLNFNEESLMEIALKQEISVGKAQILVTVEQEKGAELYDCEITKINHTDSITKNLSIKICDDELIEKTGGIVQGMSGSPIIQNGKLIGAVTHVLVDDPTKGYGIFAENMLETAQLVSEQQLKEAS